jgi:hypothetical protein
MVAILEVLGWLGVHGAYCTSCCAGQKSNCRLGAFSGFLQCFAYDVKVADMVGQKQDKRGVHGVALSCAQIAVGLDQTVVKVVGHSEVGLCVER